MENRNSIFDLMSFLQFVYSLVNVLTFTYLLTKEHRYMTPLG